MLSCPRPVLRSPQNDMKPGCQTNAFSYISRYDILYVVSKQVKNPFLLIMKLLGMINCLNVFPKTYISCVVDVVDQLP